MSSYVDTFRYWKTKNAMIWLVRSIYTTSNTHTNTACALSTTSLPGRKRRPIIGRKFSGYKYRKFNQKSILFLISITILLSLPLFYFSYELSTDGNMKTGKNWLSESWHTEKDDFLAFVLTWDQKTTMFGGLQFVLTVVSCQNVLIGSN